MRTLGFALIALALASGPAWAAGPGPNAAVDPRGDWLVHDGTAVIHIDGCTDVRDALCGVIAWTKTPGGFDKNNPDPTKRDTPILGLPILSTMKPSSSGGRWDGEVYNAENGKTYTAYIELKSPDVLRIEGCVLGGLLCGGEDWTRTELPKEPPHPPAPAKPERPAPRTK